MVRHLPQAYVPIVTYMTGARVPEQQGLTKFSNILSSCLNPATCNPEEDIFCAWALASIPEVLTQNTENIAEKTMKNIR